MVGLSSQQTNIVWSIIGVLGEELHPLSETPWEKEESGFQRTKQNKQKHAPCNTSSMCTKLTVSARLSPSLETNESHAHTG